jgi:hypothetical protein
MSGRVNPFDDYIHMVPQDIPTDPPPKYKVDREDTLRPHWWNVREWRKRVWAFLAAGVIIVIIVIVVAVVEVEKENAYPTYAPLNYSLAETCAYSLLLLGQF